jgi:hypothetical protein
MSFLFGLDIDLSNWDFILGHVYVSYLFPGACIGNLVAVYICFPRVTLYAF